MTIQTMTRRGLWLPMLTKNLAPPTRIVRTLVLALVLTLGIAAPAAVTATPAMVEMSDGGTLVATVTLNSVVANGQTIVAMNSTYVGKYPTSFLYGGLAGDGQTVDITVTNAPGGRHTVGTIDVLDESDTVVAVLTVRLKDGGIEVDLADIF